MSIFSAVALKNEPIPNTVNVAVKVMRWPSTSINQELTSMLADMVARNPVAIHCA